MDIFHEWITIDFRDKLSHGTPRVSGGGQNWKDVIKKDLRKIGISWDEVEEAAEDRRNRVTQCRTNQEPGEDHRFGQCDFLWITVDFRDKLSHGNPRVSGGGQNWKDVIKKDLRKIGISWDEVEEAAEDRRNRVTQCRMNQEPEDMG